MASCVVVTEDGFSFRCVTCGRTLISPVRLEVWQIHLICSDGTDVSAKGPGDYLHDMILRWTGEGMTLGCDCKAWIAKMNAWGPAGCREHLNEIVAHMLEEAKKRGWKLAGLPGAATVAGLAVRRACRMAEKAEAARAN